jgi:hypothetical protein
MPKLGVQSRSAITCQQADMCRALQQPPLFSNGNGAPGFKGKPRSSPCPLPPRLLLAPCSEQQPPMAPLLHAAPHLFAAHHPWTSTPHGTLVSTPTPSPSSSSRPSAPPLSTRHPCSREPSLTSPSAVGSLPAVAVREEEEDLWCQ